MHRVAKCAIALTRDANTNRPVGTELQAKPEHLRIQHTYVGPTREGPAPADTVDMVMLANQRRCAAQGPITEEEAALAKTFEGTELGRALLPEFEHNGVGSATTANATLAAAASPPPPSTDASKETKDAAAATSAASTAATATAATATAAAAQTPAFLPGVSVVRMRGLTTGKRCVLSSMSSVLDFACACVHCLVIATHILRGTL
jgi:hypothetical protein